MNKVGLNMPQDAFYTFCRAALYSLMKHSDIENYNADNYCELLAAVGFECDFYKKEDVEEGNMEPLISRTPDAGRLDELLVYLNSDRFVDDTRGPYMRLS